MSEARRVKRLQVSAELLAHMFRRDDRIIDSYVVTEGMPEDATIIGASYEWPFVVVLIVHSSEFDIVGDGWAIPELTITGRSYPKPTGPAGG